MNRFVHFELASNDLEKTAGFYREVFGWDIQKWDGPIDYWLVTTGEQGAPGIDGGLMKADEIFRGIVNTIAVDDIDVYIEKVKACGGEIVLDKDLIPGVGYQAYFRDNTGILVGLHQALPNQG